VAVKILNKVFVSETNVKSITVGYAGMERLCRMLRAMSMLRGLFMVEGVRGRGILG
jgi:glutamate mutase epsilon subunit